MLAADNDFVSSLEMRNQGRLRPISEKVEARDLVLAHGKRMRML